MSVRNLAKLKILILKIKQVLAVWEGRGQIIQGWETWGGGGGCVGMADLVVGGYEGGRLGLSTVGATPIAN